MELPSNANQTASAENNAAAEPVALPTITTQNVETPPVPQADIGGEPTREVASVAEEFSEEDLAAIIGDSAPPSNIKPLPEAPASSRLSAEDISAITEGIPAEGRSFQVPSDAAPTVDMDRARQVEDLSRRLKVSSEEAFGLLGTKPYEELMAAPELAKVIEAYPGLYTWAQDPENYKILTKNPKKAMTLADNSDFLKNATSETAKLMKSNWYQLLQISLHSAMSTGKISTDVGAQKLQELDQLIKSNQTEVHAEGVQKFGESYLKMKDQFEKSGREFNQVNFTDNVSMDDYLADMAKIYRGVGKGAQGIGDVLSAVWDDPSAFAVGVAGQSLYSMGPSIAAGAAGTKVGTAILGPVGGAIAGISSGVITQAAVSYGQYFQQASDKFRNPKTGIVDYKAMYSDPEVVAGLRKQGAKYAAAHAAFEFVASKFIKTNVAAAKVEMSMAKGLGETAKIAGKTAVKGAAATVAEESTGEFIAQKVTGESTADALGEAVVEGLAGGLMGIGKVAVEFAVTDPMVEVDGKSIPVPEMKGPSIRERVQDFRKAKKTEAQAEQAVNQANAITESVESIKELGLDQHKNKAEELIEEATSITEIDSEGDVDVKPSTATISINELGNLAIAQGSTVDAILTSMGENVSAAYYASLNNGIPDFTVSLADLELGLLDLPELEGIAYINDSEINGVEGREILDGAPEVFEQMNKEIEATIDLHETDNSGDSDMTYDQVIGETSDEQFNALGEDVSTVLRPIEVRFRGRSRDEMEVFAKIQKEFKASIGNTTIEGDPAFVDAATEVAFQNLKFRADTLGVPVKDLAKKVNFSGTLKEGKSLGISRNFYDNSTGITRLIKLFLSPEADAITVVHELGHQWLDNMSEDYSFLSEQETLTEDQKNYKGLIEMLAGKLGLSDIRQVKPGALSNEQRTLVHETFAQTTEQYFIEGKAPAGRMKAVMDLMRKWTAVIANNTRRLLRAYPTLKVDGEIQRLFNTILRAEVKATQEVDDIFVGPIFDPRILSGQRGEAYRELLKEVREQAIADVARKSYDKSFKEREALIDDTLDSIYANASEDVALTPEIQFRNMLQNGEPELRIRYESFLAVIAGGDENAAQNMIALLPKKIVSGKKKAGMDIREYMAQLGITDPASMLDFMMMGSQEDLMIEDRANEMIDLFFPALKTDEEIHNIAVEAVNATPRERLIRAELKLLAEKSPKKLMELASIVATPAGLFNKEISTDDAYDSMSAMSDTLLNTTKVKFFSPSRFLALANRYGRRAAKYLAKGDFDAAFEMKQMEAMYFIAYRKSLGMKKKVDATTKNFKRFGKLTDRRAAKELKMDPDFVGYIKALGISLSTSGGFPRFDKGSMVNRLIITDSFVDKVNEIIDVINANIGETSNANLSAEDYLNLGKVVRMTARAARETRLTEDGVLNESIESFGEVAAAQIGTRKKGDPTAKVEDSFFSKLGIDLVTVENFFSGLFPDESSYGKSAIAKMLSIVKNAEAHFQKAKNDDWKIIEEAVKKAAKVDPSNRGVFAPIRRRFLGFKGANVGTPIAAPELNHTFNNKGELLMAVLFYGSESGRQTLFEGGLTQDSDNLAPIGGFNPTTGKFESQGFSDFLARAFAEKILTKEDMDFVQTIWDVYASHFDSVKAGVRDVHKFDIGYIEPAKVSTPWGNYRGGYVPLVRAMTREKSDKLLKSFVPEGVDTPASEMFAFFTPSMAKERTKKVVPLSLDLTQLRYNINAVYRVAYIVPTMWRVAKIFNDKGFNEAIEARRPGAMDALLIPWAARTTMQQYSGPVDSNTFQAASRVIEGLRVNTATGAFIISYATWLKQFLGLLPAAALVGKRRMNSALMTYLTNLNSMKAEIVKKSPVMAQRFETNVSRGIKSFEDFTYNFDWINNFRGMTEKLAYLPIQMSQNIVDGVVFTAAMDYAKNVMKVDEKTAIAYAESVVERTQSTSSVSGRPAIMSMGGEYGRAVTMFGSQVLAMHGMNRASAERNADASAPTRLAVAGYVLGMTVLVPAMLGHVISEGPFGIPDDEDDWEEYLKEMAIQAAKETIDAKVPFVGNPVLELLRGNTQRALTTLPVVRTTVTIGKTLSNLGAGNLLEGELPDPKMGEREFKDLMTTINAITGIQTTAINKVLREIEKIEE